MTPSPRPLHYQVPPAPPPPLFSRAEKTWAVACLGLLVAWLLMLAYVSGPSSVYFWIRWHSNEEAIAVVLLLALVAVRQFNRTKTRRLSFLAVFAFLLAGLNPVLMENADRALGLHWILGGDKAGSFLAGLVALIAGAVATVRIRRRRRTLWGLRFSLIGLVAGFLWVGLWVALAVAFAYGMSGVDH